MSDEKYPASLPTPPTAHRDVSPCPDVTMSVAYEPRSFHEDSPYAPVGENDHDMNKFINEANVDDMANLAAATYEPANEPSPAVFDPSPSPAVDLHPVAPPNVDPTNVPVRDQSPAAPIVFQAMPHRIKPIVKPHRDATKSEDGKYLCTFPDCSETVRKFHRRCEWSKHMDKHERPYVCTAKGCEKILGFTYSGGLLRHEREVHGKHGGPKKKLLCPHVNCKRSSGKGFSRQENLSEHLRRVHTSAGPMQIDSPGSENTEPSNSEAANVAYAALKTAMSPANLDDHLPGVGEKRKRSVDDDAGRAHGGDDDDDNRPVKFIRADNKRLRKEIAELQQALEESRRSGTEMQSQLTAIQHALGNPTIGQTLAFQQPPEL